MPALNVIDRDNLLRVIARLTERINTLEANLQGVPINTVRIADAAITNAKIDTLTWDKAQGGTATLGGAANVDGVLTVLDASAAEKVRIDKDGLLINSGKLVIKNDSETISIDAKGIISTANFVQTNSANGTLNQSISGTSETDVTGATLSFTLDRSKSVLFLFNTSNYLVQSVGNTGNFTVRLRVESPAGSGTYVEVSRTINTGLSVTDGQGHTYSSFYINGLASGSRTVKLTGQLESTTGSPSATVLAYQLSYLILGT